MPGPIELEIVAIRREATNKGYENDHERITHLKAANNTIFSVNDAVLAITTKMYRFFVRDEYGNQAWLEVVKPLHNAWYVRTYRDGVASDNLLSLPEF